MKQRILLAAISVWTALFDIRSIVNACSVCLTGANDPTADAFNWSVIFLMAMPYTVVGSIAGWLFFSYRRSAAKQKEQEEKETAEPVVHLALNPEESGR
jgi:nicotinamide riboside transporter PnuC